MRSRSTYSAGLAFMILAMACWMRGFEPGNQLPYALEQGGLIHNDDVLYVIIASLFSCHMHWDMDRDCLCYIDVALSLEISCHMCWDIGDDIQSIFIEFRIRSNTLRSIFSFIEAKILPFLYFLL